MNVTPDSVARNDLMAGHQGNHITAVYVLQDKSGKATRVFACMVLTP